MNAREFREQVDAALAPLEGDTGPVRRMLFELHSQLKAVTRMLDETREEMAAANARLAQLQDLARTVGVQAEALRQQATRAAANQAALEGEVASLKAKPTHLALVGKVSCMTTGKNYILDGTDALDEWPPPPAKGVLQIIHYDADTMEDVRKLRRMWKDLRLSELHSYDEHRP
jgi:hypothetical protein